LFDESAERGIAGNEIQNSWCRGEGKRGIGAYE